MNSFNLLSTALILLKQYSECHQNSEIHPLHDLKAGEIGNTVVGSVVFIKDVNSQKDFLLSIVEIQSIPDTDPAKIAQKLQMHKKIDPGYINLN